MNRYLPVMLPELKFANATVIPSFYGKKCVTGMALRKSIYFRFEQPDLISVDQKIVPDLGSCKVEWKFQGRSVRSEFTFVVKTTTTLESLRYVLPIAAPHSRYRLGTTFALGAEGHRCSIEKDDFQCVWKNPEVVSEEPLFKTCYGKIHYLQVYAREHPLVMRPGQQDKLIITYDPDIVFRRRIG